jgi:hypothetical protein
MTIAYAEVEELISLAAPKTLSRGRRSDEHALSRVYHELWEMWDAGEIDVAGLRAVVARP